MKAFKEFFGESLWANINNKRKSGKRSARKGSKAYKAAKKAGDKLEASKENEEAPSEEDHKYECECGEAWQTKEGRDSCKECNA